MRGLSKELYCSVIFENCRRRIHVWDCRLISQRINQFRFYAACAKIDIPENFIPIILPVGWPGILRQRTVLHFHSSVRSELENNSLVAIMSSKHSVLSENRLHGQTFVPIVISTISAFLWFL